MTALDDFWFITVIHTYQYISLALLYVLLNQFNEDKGTLFLPEAGHTFIVVVLCIAFSLPIPQQSKVIP